MPIDRHSRLARIWSNAELRRFAHLFSGEIANISAGEDIDKEGGYYRTYFSSCNKYTTTNYSFGSYRGFGGRPGELELDLTASIPSELKGRFDAVYNHTTLEHIFDVRNAAANLCAMSRDIVILVVPFAQIQHQAESFGDYWRFTPTCIRALFKENGLEIVYESANNDLNAATYLFCIGSRHPDKWKDSLPSTEPILSAGSCIGDRRVMMIRYPPLPRIARRLYIKIRHWYRNRQTGIDKPRF